MDNQEFEKFIHQDYSSFADWLFSLDPYTFTLIATTAGFAISPLLTVNQQNSLGNFFELLGQLILTISSQNVTIRDKKHQKPGIQSGLEKQTLEEEIINLKEEVIRLRDAALGNNYDGES